MPVMIGVDPHKASSTAEVDEIEWQGDRVYLHLGVRRDDPPRR
jgi:hypothetical protein